MARAKKATRPPAKAAKRAVKSATSKKNRATTAGRAAGRKPAGKGGSPPARGRAAAPSRGRAAAPSRGRASAPARGRAAAARAVDATLFDPLTEGERADALRILTEDRRLATMAKVARYRVIAAEPIVLKPPHPLSGRRLARAVAYDYSALRCVDALVDLDAGEVAFLQMNQSQPGLAREEESAAVAIAVGDERVKRELGLGDEPIAALHYWSRREADLAYARRSAAVLLGQPGRRPSLVAVVDLVDGQVTEVVPADQW
ncbi:MAG TPA: hypothetical protein VKZ63_21990 [Kofleriaceae bacterium]|nr:hypothetical protein [Kofleriaceae bacterium]